MKLKELLLVNVFFMMFGVASLQGDYRYYAWTYQFMTMMPGEAELEFYTRIDQPNIRQPEKSKWKRQVEIEIGLTHNWDFSFYLVDNYKPTEGKTKFEEVKLRTRYKLANKDEFYIDPILYLEYKIQTDRNYPDKWETKLILAKDIDNLNISSNIILEEYYKTGTKEKDWKIEYVYGISYPIIDLFRIGIEGKGDLKEKKHAVGPSIAFKGKKIWAAIGALFKLNEKTDELQMQGIIGIWL